MGAKLLEFDMFLCNEQRAMYMPLRPLPNGDKPKPFSFGVQELPYAIPRVEFAWGAQSSINTRAKRTPIPMPFMGMF